MADFGIRVGNVLRLQSTIYRPPGLACGVGTERARRRDGNEHPLMIGRINQNGMQAKAACAWLPARSCAVAAQSREFLPGLSAVRRAEQGSILNPGINCIGIG